LLSLCVGANIDVIISLTQTWPGIFRRRRNWSKPNCFTSDGEKNYVKKKESHNWKKKKIFSFLPTRCRNQIRRKKLFLFDTSLESESGYQWVKVSLLLILFRLRTLAHVLSLMNFHSRIIEIRFYEKEYVWQLFSADSFYILFSKTRWDCWTCTIYYVKTKSLLKNLLSEYLEMSTFWNTVYSSTLNITTPLMLLLPLFHFRLFPWSVSRSAIV
jgi:hypothetical protein